jgi:hypothetical protein
MTKTKLSVPSIVLVVLAAVAALTGAFGGVASAQTSGSAAPGAAAEPAAPAAAATPPATPTVADPRAACTAAMNADPKFAAAIVKVADEKAALARDEALIATHRDAELRVQTNEKHVIYAYAGIWIIAAGFVIFLWRRQEALKSEIAGLRRELEAAADDAKPQPGRK